MTAHNRSKNHSGRVRYIESWEEMSDAESEAYLAWMTALYEGESLGGLWHKHEKGVLIAAFHAGWRAHTRPDWILSGDKTEAKK